MELTRRKRSSRLVMKRSIETNVEPYHDLLLYVTPPISTIPLAELYNIALDRMKALKIVEQALSRGLSKNIEDKKSAVLQEFKKQGLKTYARLLYSTGCGEPSELDLKARNEDHVSHFILRLAHCHSENLRRWFITKEWELFRMRYSSMNMEGIRNFLAAYKLEFIPISAEEKNSLMDLLVESTLNVTLDFVQSKDFYKVPFTDVLDLVSSRRVFLRAGNAYIPSRDLLSIVGTIFKDNLSRGLHMTANGMAFLEEDERLRSLINLHKIDMSDAYDRPKNTGKVLPEDLDHLSRVSFPLCMRQCHESVRSTHHAKHGTRMQYGLFLKSIGLSLDDAVRFWREEFTRNMGLDKFEKQYLYNIRHNYGQEGKRTSYSSFSCMKILTGAVGAGDCHGCPFKHNSTVILKKQLEDNGIPIVEIPSILNFVGQRQYELACTKYFEIMHPNTPVEAIYHPKQYYELSRKYYGEGDSDIKKPIKENKVMNPVKTYIPIEQEIINDDDDWDVWQDESVMDIDVTHVIEQAKAVGVDKN